MNPREFFYAVAQMRQAQREYFKLRTPDNLRRARWLEGEIDREIARTKAIVEAMERDGVTYINRNGNQQLNVNTRIEEPG